MHGYDYRTGGPNIGPTHPSNSGSLGPLPMGHLGSHGNLTPNAALERMYQPPPPGLENNEHIPPPMRDNMGVDPNHVGGGLPIMSDGGGILVPHDGYIGDDLSMNSGHSAPTGLCGVENHPMVQPSHESSGYTLTSLDANSPMGSES